MARSVDLVVPVEAPDRAKSRLIGARLDRPAPAFAPDTTAAATGRRGVPVVTSDHAVAGGAARPGVESVAGPRGLNEASRHGYGVLRSRDAASVVRALRAGLPASRTAEWDSAGGRSARTGRAPARPCRRPPGGALDPWFDVGPRGVRRPSHGSRVQPRARPTRTANFPP